MKLKCNEKISAQSQNIMFRFMTHAVTLPTLIRK